METKDYNEGSLTVEALLFLIPFIMAFCTLINAARYVQAEMLIHHAVTQTAKQISTYSYVLTKTKISSRIVETNRKSEELKVTIDDATSSVEGFINAVSDMDGLAEGGDEGRGKLHRRICLKRPVQKSGKYIKRNGK